MSKKKPKVNGIGLIVEDSSDFDTVRALIKKHIGVKGLRFKKKAGGGCGKMRNKALSYAKELKNKGCNMVILVHDLDGRELEKLRSDLSFFVKKSPAEFNFICIPNEEIEAWLLSDENAVNDLFKLSKKMKSISNPENITSPKEHLEKIIYQNSNKTKRYISTQHNLKIAELMDIGKASKKCKSFEELLVFLDSFRYE
ncbi:MAG: DUF4276 family protein [Bacteroidota bacterium]